MSSTHRVTMKSPPSSFATAMYHYTVKTFAVRNGCEHHPDDIEGFGRTLRTICDEVQRILKSEPRHGHMTSPCYVVGDLHGNFRDLFYFMDNLISFQELCYLPHKFMFLGNYVNRGEFSVEVIAYLFSMKVLAPEKILLLRGNHEDTLISGDIHLYGSTSFRAQCRSLFGMTLGEEVWGRVSEVFMYLPLTANIDKTIFCAHGGIPRLRPREDGSTVEDRLEQLTRGDFPPMKSFFEDPEKESSEHARMRRFAMETCWADPAEEESTLDADGFDNPCGEGTTLFVNKAVGAFLNHYGFQDMLNADEANADGLQLSNNAWGFTSTFGTSPYVGDQNGAGMVLGVLVADGTVRLIEKNGNVKEEEEQEEVVKEEELEEEGVIPEEIEEEILDRQHPQQEQQGGLGHSMEQLEGLQIVMQQEQDKLRIQQLEQETQMLKQQIADNTIEIPVDFDFATTEPRQIRYQFFREQKEAEFQFLLQFFLLSFFFLLVAMVMVPLVPV